MDQTLDLSYLSPEEYQKILEVIKRDQDLKRQEDQRVFKLKAELQRLRKRGIIRQGALDPTRTCARCLIDLGCFVNRGADCPVCRKRVCKSCRHYTDGQDFVCLVCQKQTQLKAITGEWMREYTRTASGRFKKGSTSTTSPSTSPPVKSSAGDAISNTIKNTLKQTFLVNSNHSSSDSGSTGELSVFNFASTSAQENNHNEKSDIDDNTNPVPHLSSISSISIVKSLAKGFIPRLPPLDSLPPKSPPPKSPKSPKSPLSGSSHLSSTDSKEDSLTSPKLPPSPVLKALQSSAEYASSTPGSIPGGTGSQNSSRHESPQHQKQTVFKKVSNRMLESSSSEDEEEIGEPPVSPGIGKEELHKTNSSGSTPSPRTPNSCRILSSIAANQATAFKFPPSGGSPIHSRPSSYERQSERQSSDEFSTPMSSFRSRSTSSEFYDDSISTDPRLTPQPLPRSRRVSPLRKQRAIAEELHESQRSSLEAEYGSCPSSATVSAPDSGVADCNYASPPKNFFSSASANSSITRSTSGHDQPFATDSATVPHEHVTSLSEGEAVVERVTGYVFRKVTIKKRNSTPPQASPHPRHDSLHHNSVDNPGSSGSTQRISTTNSCASTHDRPTTDLGLLATVTPFGECEGLVEQAVGIAVDGQQSHWNISGDSSASLTHKTGEVKHQKQEHQNCANRENTKLIINSKNFDSNSIQKYEFEANNNNNSNKSTSSFTVIEANSVGTRLISSGVHQYYNYCSTVAGLGLRSQSYYYLYGSVTRCDACDACDKDMACERANTSALLSSSSEFVMLETSAQTANHIKSSGKQPEEQNSQQYSTGIQSISQFCQNVLNEAFSCANQEIRRLTSMTIIDDNDINFVDLLIDSQTDIAIIASAGALDTTPNDFPDNYLKDDFKTTQNSCDFSTSGESSSEEEFETKNIYNSCDTLESEPTEDLEVEEYPEERSVSNLEKYFTHSLEEQISDDERRTSLPSNTYFNSMSPFSDNEEWVDDSTHILDDSSTIDIRCSADDLDIDLENGHISDGSTSSEEGLYSTPNTHYTRAQPAYGNPLAYSLHTILEESCEESDRNSSRPSSPKSDNEVNANDVNEAEKMFSYSVSHYQCNEDHKRGSWCQSEADSVDSLTESESTMSADFTDTEVYLSSSRLEKYFTTGLLGSGAFDYPDDCEFADESDCDSSKPSLELLKQTESNQQNETVFVDKNCDNLMETQNSNQTVEQNNENTEPKVNEVIELLDNKQEVIEIQSNVVSNIESIAIEEEKQPIKETIEFSTTQTSVKQSVIESNESTIITRDKLQCDEEVKTFMNRLLSRMSGFSQITGTDGQKKNVDNQANIENGVIVKSDNPLPSLKILESQIARLMEAVSPANLSASSDSNSSYTSSSTIGSNNSDYGSDTLESDEEESKTNPSNSEKRKAGRLNRNGAHNSGASSDSTVSEETVYICKQLMTSLKKLTEIAFNDKEKSSDSVTVPINGGVSDVAKARMYIRDQIVALMHTVKSSSPASTPPTVRDRKSSQTPFNHQSVVDSDTFGGDSSDCGESSPKMGGSGDKKKAPSESGSETTCSASVSIPSYDDSDHTPTESEISHEMEELFALLDSSAKDTLVLNESNLIGIAARPSSDEDRASLKSWEARISLFGKLQSEDQSSDKTVAETSIEVNPLPNISAPNKSSEITVNGKEIRHKMSSNSSAVNSLAVNQSSANSTANTTAPILIPIGHKTVVKIDDSMANRTESMSPLFDSLKDRSFSSDSVSSVQTVKARFGTLATASTSEISSDGTQSTSRLAIDEVDDESEPNLTSNSLRKSFNAKEKASSEDNLLVVNLMTVPGAKAKPSACTTKSAGNISELETNCNKSGFRDTGYYSFKSSEESIKSLDESSATYSHTVGSHTSVRAHSVSTLPLMKHLKSETIEEVDEESYASDVISHTMSKTMPQTKRLFTPSSHTTSSAKIHSYSSPNIPDDVFSSRSCSLPLRYPNHRALPSQVQPCMPHRSRSSFFSTSGVLRKLTALRGDDNSFRASPRRLRDRTRNNSGGKDGIPAKRTGGGGVPQISVSDYSESFSTRGSLGSSDGQSTERHDSEENVENVFAFHRSQTSLSSFGARSESLSSVYSAAGGGRYGSVVVTGEILFSISYNYKAGAMEVYIRECRNLAPVDTKRMRSDPYVKVYLLPDRTKSGKRKTKVKKHTLNPVFEEVLKFYMTISEVETRDLWLSVWHSDIFGRNDFLGEVSLPLGHEVFETPGLKWYPLQERLEVCDNQNIYRGDIFLALKYTPPETGNRRSKKFSNQSEKGELHVLIKEAHNLTATRSNGTSDPFCKSYLLPDKTKSGKQKTPVIKKTCNPKWNHTFVFEDISVDELRERCLELTIWDYDKITSNDYLGGVRLGLGSGQFEDKPCDWMDSIGDEIALWQQMLDRPNMWVYGELHLRSSMQTRRS